MTDSSAQLLSERVGFTAAIPAILLIGALAGGGLFSLVTGGRQDVGLADLWGLLAWPDENDLGQTVMWDIRLPRSIAAASLGVGLGLAGLTLQAITRNPLASPSILGINQGAALGLALSILLPDLLRVTPALAATLGALAAGTLTFAIAGGFSGQMRSARLILGGVAVGAFAYATVRFAYTLEDELARSVVRWTVGDITDIRWPATMRLLFWIVPGFFLAIALSQRLNLMALGIDTAQGVGADPRVTLMAGTVLASAMAGVCVSAAGPIAFTGLVVPHLAKMAFGGDHRLLVPASAAIGAALMLVADGLSKVLVSPVEAPIGVVAALIGAPWFLWQTLVSRDLE